MLSTTELEQYNSVFSEQSENVFLDYKKYFKEKYNLKVYENQIEIFDAITNPLNHYISIVQSRGGGKTFATALGLLEVCRFIPSLKIGVFAPKVGQAKKMIKQIYDIIKDAPPEVQDCINTKVSSSEKLIFNNGTIIEAMSANERTMSEGAHYHCVVVDEAHLVSDYSMSSKILPMLGSYKYHQLIKIGVSMFKNHFHRSFKDKKYKILKRDWLECDILKESGLFEYEGQYYSQYVVDMMPNEAKKKYFPNRPDILSAGGGEISHMDFLMQYELEWLDDISLFLSEEQQKKFLGTHKLELNPTTGTTYFFGLDTAGGSVDPNTLELDYTALSIWSLRGKQLIKVYAQKWQGSPTLQFEEILEVLKRFKVTYGLIDYSNIGIGFVEMFKENGIRCEGIMFGKSCPESKKDYKTTMYDNFLTKLDLGMLKYPKPLTKEEEKSLLNTNPQMVENYDVCDEHFYEWCVLERIKSKRSIKMRIEAPKGQHDDGPDADVLSIYSVNKMGHIGVNQQDKFNFLLSKATFFS